MLVAGVWTTVWGMGAMTADDSFRALVESIVLDVLSKQKPTEPTSDAITVTEYARRYSISENTVRAAIRTRRLAAIRVGRSVRIPANATIGKATSDATARAREKLLGGKVR